MSYTNVSNRYTIGNVFFCVLTFVQILRTKTNPDLQLGLEFLQLFVRNLSRTLLAFQYLCSFMHVDVELGTVVITKPLLPIASCSELISILLFVFIFFRMFAICKSCIYMSSCPDMIGNIICYIATSRNELPSIHTTHSFSRYIFTCGFSFIITIDKCRHSVKG